MSKFKSDKTFDLPNGLYSAIWIESRISFRGYDSVYTFFTKEYVEGGYKTELWEGTIELINGIAYVDDKQGWISHYQPLDSTYDKEKGYWCCHGK